MNAERRPRPPARRSIAPRRSLESATEVFTFTSRKIRAQTGNVNDDAPVHLPRRDAAGQTWDTPLAALRRGARDAAGASGLYTGAVWAAESSQVETITPTLAPPDDGQAAGTK